MEQLITTIAPAGEPPLLNESGPGDEIGGQLRAILGSGRVLDRMIDRIAFSSDASFYSLVPQAIAQPATLEEVGALFRFSRTQKVPLVFRAGGTSVCDPGTTGCHWSTCERHSKAIWRKDRARPSVHECCAPGRDPFQQRERNVLRRVPQCLSHPAIDEVHASIRHRHRHRAIRFRAAASAFGAAAMFWTLGTENLHRTRCCIS